MAGIIGHRVHRHGPTIFGDLEWDAELLVMSAQVSTIEIERPPDRVFAYITDVRRFPEWQDDVVRVEVDGERFVTTRKIAGQDRITTQVITDNNPPTSWAARGIDGPIR